jgi:hypothetical protein
VANANPELCLLLPGLCGPDSDPPVSDYLEPRPAALDRLLSRSVVTAGDAGLEAALCRHFGLPVDAAAVPVAPLCYRRDVGVPAAGYVMRADPVHLRADQSVLRLFDASTFSLAQDEADALVASFNDFYAGQGMQLIAPCAQRWYLVLAESPHITTTAVHAAGGRDIDTCLPRGDDATVWHRVLNEVQMLFHDHPVNRRRSERGEPAINSVWFWGGGVLPGPLAPRLALVATDHELAQGLALHSGTARRDMPADAAELLPLAGDGVTLVVLDTLAAPTQYGDVERWLEGLRALQAHWFRPLLDAMKQGRLDSLEIDPCNGARFRFDRWRLAHFWKRDRAFEAVCRTGMQGRINSD